MVREHSLPYGSQMGPPVKPGETGERTGASVDLATTPRRVLKGEGNWLSFRHQRWLAGKSMKIHHLYASILISIYMLNVHLYIGDFPASHV